MIWHDGRIVEPEAVRVDLADRVFEHGLGLFETLRTRQGRAELLDRHLDRLRSSAIALGLPLDGVALPDDPAVTALLKAEAIVEAMIRITMTAGTSSGHRPVVWMTAKRLPPDDSGPVIVCVHDVPIAQNDRLARHKTLNYWSRRLAHARAESLGAVDSLLTDARGRLWEGSRNNVLFVPEGRPDTLVTPDLDGPIVPGIMRRASLDYAAGIGYRIEERPVTIGELDRAEVVYLTNSVRGVRRVGRIDGRTLNGESERELTRRLTVELPDSFLRGA